jgi:hypothetical protein
MANTFVRIASATVGSGGASSINFTSIPGTYTDLCIKVSARSTRNFGWDALRLRFNGSSTGYSDRVLAGNGSSPFAFTNAVTNYIFSGDINDAGTTSNTFSVTELYIPNYASSNNKSISTDSAEENNATTAQANLISAFWTNTSAITSIELTCNAGNFVENSTAVLYGISKQ